MGGFFLIFKEIIMSCNRTICTIWHECDKQLGEEFEPLCSEENFKILQQLKAEIRSVAIRIETCHDDDWPYECDKIITKLRELSTI